MSTSFNIVLIWLDFCGSRSSIVLDAKARRFFAWDLRHILILGVADEIDWQLSETREVCSHAVGEANDVVGVDLEYLNVLEEIIAFFWRIVDGGEMAAENRQPSPLEDILEDFRIQLLVFP
jgi:hypothetical protein